MNAVPAVESPLTIPGVLAVTGSKGGIGKSCLVVNLGIALTGLGRRVIVVDGDLGMGNLDVLLGLAPDHNIEQLIRGESELEETLIDGPCGIRVLPSASGVPRLGHLDQRAAGRLNDALVECIRLADIVLVDTGAGLSEATLSLQGVAERVLLVTTPEPASLIDAYATLKVIWDSDPTKPVDVVVNCAADEDEARHAFRKIAETADRFLGRRPGQVGYIANDGRVQSSVRKQRALMELFPTSAAGLCVQRLAASLVSTGRSCPARIVSFEPQSD